MSNNQMVSVPRALLERIKETCMFTMLLEDYDNLRVALGNPAEQHQGEPVKLPERKTDHLSDSVHGWNACLDEIAKLGPLYTHAGPAEVERLREQVETLRLMTNDYLVETERLRAQLAEAERLRSDLAALRRWETTLLAEVERLKRRAQDADLALAAQTKQVHNLRAQLATETARADSAVGDANEAERKLAEAHALLREADEFMYAMTGNDTQRDLDARYGALQWEDAICALRGRIASSLSASAEPSAPTWSCQACQVEQPTDRPFDVCGGKTEPVATKS